MPYGDRNDNLSSDEKLFSLICHISAFVHFIPMAPILVPLVIYFMKRDESMYIAHHACEALNFQISLYIYAFIIFLLWITILGIPFALVLGAIVFLLGLIVPIVAIIRALDGIYYRAPMTFRLI